MQFPFCNITSISDTWSKYKAMNDVRRIYQFARYHKTAVAKIAGFLENAEHNFKKYARVRRLLVIFSIPLCKQSAIVPYPTIADRLSALLLRKGIWGWTKHIPPRRPISRPGNMLPFSASG